MSILPIIYLEHLHNPTVNQEDDGIISVFCESPSTKTREIYSRYTSDKFRMITFDNITGILEIHSKLLKFLVMNSDGVVVKIATHPISPVEVYECNDISIDFMENEMCELYTELSHNISIRYSLNTSIFCLVTHSTNLNFFREGVLSLEYDKIFWDFGEIVSLDL